MSIAALAGQKYISLTTYRKNGEGVPTPVWFAEENGKLYITTREASWKVKRIRNNPKVRFAPCSFRGQILGDWMDGTARIIPESEGQTAYNALARKFGWQFTFGGFVTYKLMNNPRVFIEVTPI
jgi:uncharacterized protein